MKRDIDLVRKILLFLEQDETEQETNTDLSDVEEQILLYHAHILIQAEYLEGNISTYESGEFAGDITSCELTWQGHEFLDSIRDKNVWGKISPVLSTSKNVSFFIVKEMAAEAFKRMIFG